MTNTANINRLIDVLKADNGVHFHMEVWAAKLKADGKPSSAQLECHEVCKTTFCLCGWVNHMILSDKIDVTDINNFWHDGTGNPNAHSYAHEMGDKFRAAQWLGINGRQANDLFLMEDCSRERFDKLPRETRAELAILVLEQLRDKDSADWSTVLINHPDEIVKDVLFNSHRNRLNDPETTD